MPSLEELTKRYLTAECEVKNPTPEDVETQIAYGVEIYGSKTALHSALLYQFGYRAASA